MLLHTRGDAVGGLHTGVVTTELARTSRLVSRLTGYLIQPNKAVVGRNAFAHESGIHQDGVLKERATFEIMDATTVGLESNQLVLGKHSGRHALRQALEELGYDGRRPGAEHRLQALQGDRGQEEAGHRDGPRGARHRRAARGDRLRAGVVRRRGELDAGRRTRPSRSGCRTGRLAQGSFTGDGPVDAVFHAINAATGVDARLREYRVDAVSEGPGRARRRERRARARGPQRDRPGRLDGHHRGIGPGLPARAHARRGKGRARRCAAAQARGARAAAVAGG